MDIGGERFERSDLSRGVGIHRHSLRDWTGIPVAAALRIAARILLSLVLGLATSIAFALEKPPYPVIFVHGIYPGGHARTWDDLKEDLKSSGWSFGGQLQYDNLVGVACCATAGDFYTFNLPKNSSQTFMRQGFELQAAITRVLAHNPGKSKVVLVAHSMGGLAARAYLQGLAAANDGDAAVNYGLRNDVAMLVTVGTPHLGSFFAKDSIQTLVAMFAVDHLFTVMQLAPMSATLNLLNNLALYPLPPQIEYRSIIGDGIIADGIGVAIRGTPDGDGIVDEKSQNLASVPLTSGLKHPTPIKVPIFNCNTSVAEVHTCETRDLGVWNAIMENIVNLPDVPKTPPAGGPLTFPLLNNPPSGSTQSPPVTFSWFGVAGATSYRIMIAENISSLTTDPNASSCTNCINVTSPVNSYTTPDGVLKSGTTYFYRVKGRSPDNVGNWSVLGSFTTAQPPSSTLSAPTITLPAVGASGQSTTPSFAWSSVGGAASYRIMVANDATKLPTDPEVAACSACAVNAVTSSNAYVPPNGALQAGQTYFWKVKARSGTSYGNWSNQASFTTSSIASDTTPPTGGTLTAQAESGQVALTWGGFSDAGGSGIGSYKVVYAVGSAPASCSAGTQLLVGLVSSFVHGPLSNGTSYFYRVCASDRAGNMSGGAVASATPQLAVPPPIIVTQPQSLVANAGSNLTIRVAATGGAPLSYQWRKFGIAMAGQTGDTLALSNVSPSDTAAYTVLVSNAAGNQLSDVATLTVNGSGALRIVDGIRLIQPPPYVANGTATAQVKIKNASGATLLIDRIQVDGSFQNYFNDPAHSRNWPAQNFSPPLSLAPGATYTYNSTNTGDVFPGVPATATARVMVKFNGVPGLQPVLDADPGMTAILGFQTIDPNQIFPINATVEPINAGSVSGTGNYISGTLATLTATPNSCFGFLKWIRQGVPVASLPVYSFQVNGAPNIVASFVSIPCSPGAPTGVTAIAGIGSATVSFSPPSNDGGATIIQYKVVATPGGATNTGATSPIQVLGLANGTSYTFTVTATNLAGTGPASAPSSSVTPVSADTTPAAFSFTSQSGVPLSTAVTSNTITVSGINAAASISITGGSYRINNGDFTAVVGTVNNGDAVSVRLTSSGSFNTQSCATLNVGGVQGAFCASTLAAPVAPGTVTLVTPIGTIVTATPTFTWNAVSGATGYDIWVGNAAGTVTKFSQALTAAQANCAAGVGTCTFAAPSALDAGAGSWWVRAKNAAGVGPWSNVTFTVSLGAPPGAVTLVTPIGTIVTATPTFTWNAVSGATGYDIWVGNAAGTVTKFSQALTAAQANCAAGVGTCTLAAPSALDAGAGSWWVRAKNAAGVGPWSNVTFTVSLGAPLGAVTLVTPIGTIVTATPTFTWNAVSGAMGYDIWVGNAAGTVTKFSQALTAAQANCAAGVGTCTFAAPSALDAGAGSWWVRAKNAAGVGPWSNVTFTVSLGAPPGAVTLVTPIGTIVTATPTFTWNAVSGATGYDIWVGNAAGTVTKFSQALTAAQANCAAGVGTCTFAAPSALNAGAGSWWVRAKNSAGVGPWSTFFFTFSAPVAPTLVSPNGVVTTVTPTFVWNARSGATGYDIWIGNASGSVTKVSQALTPAQANCAAGTGTCSFTSPIALVAGAGSWWVRAKNEAGAGPWANVTFTVSLATIACKPSKNIPQGLLTCRNWVAFAPPPPFNPNSSVFPSEDQLRASLAQLYEEGWRGIVTYSLDGTLQHVPRIAKEVGFEAVIAGLFWFDAAQLARERAAAIAQVSYIDGYVLGNEGIHGFRYTRQQLATEIQRLKADTGRPVATSEPVLQYQNDPALATLGDWVFPNVQFWFDAGIRTPALAVSSVQNQLQIIAKLAPGRTIVVKETWWPTAGEAAATQQNQTEFFRQLAATQIKFVFGEAYDEFWKSEPLGQGPHWGLHTDTGAPKDVIPALQQTYIYPYQ